MKKLFLAAALASAASGTVAHAEQGPYITIEGGAVKNERADLRVNGNVVRNDRSKYGWEAGGAIGYDFGKFRLEAEGFHHESDLKSQARPSGTYTRDSGQLSGNSNTTAAMGNILFGVGHWGGMKAYAGGGVGWARVFLAENSVGLNPIRDHDSGFAWQALAGITMPISHNVDLGVKYRYFRPDGADHFTNSVGTLHQTSLRSHSLLATLTFNFGQEAAPPPPPPPPAPVCNKGPYIVFFDWNKADITPDAANILDSAIQAYTNCGTVPIMLAGYTDSSGTPKYNLGLSARRNDSVQTYLTGHGIAGSNITTHAYGEANQRVPTADGVRELQNRRVEITYGPGSGN